MDPLRRVPLAAKPAFAGSKGLVISTEHTAIAGVLTGDGALGRKAEQLGRLHAERFGESPDIQQ